MVNPSGSGLASGNAFCLSSLFLYVRPGYGCMTVCRQENRHSWVTQLSLLIYPSVGPMSTSKLGTTGPITV